MGKYDAGESDEDKTLAYDLRQRYAKIVGDQLEVIALCRREANYVLYFKALEDLYTITKHKYKDNKSSEEDKHPENRNNIIRLANQYPAVWAGIDKKDNKAIFLIENALRLAEQHLYLKMDEASMFGSGYVDEGL